MKTFLDYLLLFIQIIFSTAVIGLAVYGGISLLDYYNDSPAGKMASSQCLDIPKTPFYNKLHRQTLENNRKRMSIYTKAQKKQLLENARQTMLVSRTILLAGCGSE